MKQTKKALICALVGAALSSPAFAYCEIRTDVEGRFAIDAKAKTVNGEVCRAYRPDNGARFGADFDCPSQRQIVTVWLDEALSDNFVSNGDYLSRLLCADEWKSTDTAASEKALYAARNEELMSRTDGHGGDDIEHYSDDCVLDGHPDVGKPGVYVCE